jgi:hypothetical protein
MVSMPRVELRADTLRVGRQVSIHFQRTLRIPDDGDVYPLPPGLGRFPLRRVADYRSRVPAAWREEGGFFLPMYQREALWIGFHAPYWRPRALKVGVGGVDAISGERWDLGLSADPQDYVVIPEQPWLDGIKAGEGFIRQFVATPLGTGTTVEAQITGTEEGGMRLALFEPKPGRFPLRGPRPRRGDFDAIVCCEAVSASYAPMGLAAGGRMAQKVYPDAHGVDTWDAGRVTELRVHIANSEQYAFITGEPAPPSPVSAATYTEFGLPWYALYDEHKGDVATSAVLRGVKSLDQLEREAGGSSAQASVLVPEHQVFTLSPAHAGV